MGNEIGNGNNLFLNVNNFYSGMDDLLRNCENDPVWGPSALGNTKPTGGIAGTPEVSSAINDSLDSVSKLLDQVQKLCWSASEPDVSDSSHPAGSLNVGSDGVITTPGGYKIEATKQFTWKITGPDGKTTEVWGDPHVKEGDGGKWDFKRDSTFVLADGTRINVKTTPWKDGKMTVTKGLEVISGNDRVQVNDIDKGKGKVGDVTKDGYANVNSFGNKDVFVMGKESDDWSFKGKEIVGSNDGGNSFKLGKDLEAGVVGPLVDQSKKNGGDEFYIKMFNQISRMYESLMGAMGGDNPPDLSKFELPDITPESQSAFARENTGALDRLSKTFAAVGAMFNALAKIFELANSIPSRRTYQPV